MKLFLKIILGFLVILILVVGGATLFFSYGLNSAGKMVISEVNVSSLKDGTYNGKYSNGRFSNEVNVTVKDHKITKIEAVKDVTFLQPDLKEKLFDRVIEKQNTKVDIVSGATVTTKAYLKSIENALTK